MSSRLNKILYNYDVFDTAESIIALEPYMVGGSGLQNIIIPPNMVIQEQEDSVPIIPTKSGIRTDKFLPKDRKSVV